MKWFENMSTSSKLILAFGIFMIILCLVIVKSLNTIYTLNNMKEALYNKQMKLVQNAIKMDDANSNIENEMWIMIVDAENQKREKSIELIKNLLSDQKLSENEMMTAVQNDQRIIIDIENYKNLNNEFIRIKDEKIIPAIIQNNFDSAKKILYEAHYDQIQKMTDLVDKMVQESNEHAINSIAQAKEEARKALICLVGTGIIAFLLSVIIIIVLNRVISKPLVQLSNAAKKIAKGDLRNPEISAGERNDEVGVLFMSFETMVKNLNKLTSEIASAINFLSSSANEIASAASQLSSTASETATSIAETSTTIEEVKQTSQVANKKASTVSEAAKKTADISEGGKKVADDIDKVISDVNTQMSLIANTMMRLNEQSQEVGTIITTVEDLAQQTNLLAVNASIEASKAGEQGKGFSVVAQEVKSLATQSKDATNQVRTILNDIQKATSAAVMATEMGNKSVELGVQKSNEAGQTILELLKTVIENAHAASQISAVSHQQLVGMEQATIAMENIKTASTQNVESSRMLKDSVTTTKELGEKLKEMISQFKFDRLEHGNKEL